MKQRDAQSIRPATRGRVVAGFRGFSDGFSYVVLSGSQEEPTVVAHDRCIFPKNEEWPGCLAWLRRELAEIVRRHGISKAALKTIEGNALRVSRPRLQVEAVIQEALWSEFGVHCLARVKSQIRRAIPGFKEPARYLDRVLDDSEALSQLKNPRFEEAVLAGFSVLPKD